MDFSRLLGPSIYDLENLTAVGQLPSQANWQLQYHIMQREQLLRNVMERARSDSFAYSVMRRNLSTLIKLRKTLGSTQFSRPGTYMLPANPHAVNNFLN
jgi:hypothetical protein